MGASSDYLLVGSLRKREDKYQGAALSFAGKCISLTAYAGGFIALQRTGRPDSSTARLLLAAAAGFASLSALGGYLDTATVDFQFALRAITSGCCLAADRFTN